MAEAQSETDIVIVKMIKRYQSNYPGEEVGFTKAKADELIKGGAATFLRNAKRPQGAAEIKAGMSQEEIKDADAGIKRAGKQQSQQAPR